MRLLGGCLCGAIRYEITGSPIDAAHCHCRICQRSAGAAFITWATFDVKDFVYSAGAPTVFRSSAEAVREFCGSCGTQLVFRGDGLDNLDVTIASLDTPDQIKPAGNIWVGSRRAWCHGFDRELPDFEGEMPFAD